MAMHHGRIALAVGLSIGDRAATVCRAQASPRTLSATSSPAAISTATASTTSASAHRARRPPWTCRAPNGWSTATFLPCRPPVASRAPARASRPGVFPARGS